MSIGIGTFGGGLGDGSPPAGSRGRAPVGGLGDFVPQKLTVFLDLGPKFFVKISTKISLFNATNIKNLIHD